MCSVAIASRRVATAYVLAVRHRFKVVRIYADAVPTKMVDLEPIRNRAFRGFVRQAMRGDHSVTPVKLAVTAAAAAPRSGTSPLPARVGLVDLRPESRGQNIGTLNERQVAITLSKDVAPAVPGLEPGMDPSAGALGGAVAPRIQDRPVTFTGAA
jgi:hypothetical protein